MKSLIPLAAVSATLAAATIAPALSHAQLLPPQGQSSSSSSASGCPGGVACLPARPGAGTVGASDASQSSSSSAVSSAASSSSPDCPANPMTTPVKPKHDPTGRTTSSCFNPYVTAPGTTPASSSSGTSTAPH